MQDIVIKLYTIVRKIVERGCLRWLALRLAVWMTRFLTPLLSLLRLRLINIEDVEYTRSIDVLSVDHDPGVYLYSLFSSTEFASAATKGSSAT